MEEAERRKRRGVAGGGGRKIEKGERNGQGHRHLPKMRYRVFKELSNFHEGLMTTTTTTITNAGPSNRTAKN